MDPGTNDASCEPARCAHHRRMRIAIVAAGLLLACGAEPGGNVSPPPVRVAELAGNGSTAGSSAEPAGGGSGAAGETNAGSAAGSTDTSSTASAGAGTSEAGGGAGTSGAGGAQGGSGQPGTTGAAPLAFPCPDPTSDDAIAWQLYTVQPGHCLIVGNARWGGQKVCRETSTTDGACDATCANYLSVRVGLFDEPVAVAVLPLFGIVVESSSRFDDADSSASCRAAPEGVFP